MWEITITPRFSELDPLGHINNTVPPIWFEQGRDPIFELFNPTLDFENWQTIMARTSVEFIRQIHFRQRARILTWVKRLGNSSLTSYQELFQGGELRAKAEAIIVHFDHATQKSVRIPDNIRAELAKHMVDKNNPNLRTRSGRFLAM